MALASVQRPLTTADVPGGGSRLLPRRKPV